MSVTCTCPPAKPPFAAVLAVDCPVHGAAAAAIATEAINQDRVIHATPLAKCDLCGEEAELRPYGPNGEDVCFSCGMKDEEAMRRGFHRRFG